MVMPCSRSAASPSTRSAKSSFAPCVPAALALGLERFELVVEDLAAIVEQPPDQGRLAVVDASAGDEAKHLLALVTRKPFGHVTGDELAILVEDARHQKYPSCFFFSMLRHRFLVDSAPLPLRRRRQQHLGDDFLDARRFALDGAGQRIAAERAEPDLAHCRLFAVERESVVVDHQQQAVADHRRPLSAK